MRKNFAGVNFGKVVVMAQYFVGDIVKMKKEHPCGNNEWEVMRTGMDFRIKCLKCQHQVWLGRPAFEKAVKKVVKRGNEAPAEN